MKIEVNEKAVEEGVNEAMTEAVRKVINGTEVKKEMVKLITEQLGEGVLAKAIRDGVNALDTTELSKRLAAEMQQATIRSMTHLLNEAVLHVICKIQGIGNFSHRDREAKERLRAELFGKQGRSDENTKGGAE